MKVQFLGIDFSSFDHWYLNYDGKHHLLKDEIGLYLSAINSANTIPKVAIYGAGMYGSILFSMLINHYDVEIVYIIDKDGPKNQAWFSGVPVVRPGLAMSGDPVDILFVATSPQHHNEIFLKLRDECSRQTEICFMFSSSVLAMDQQGVDRRPVILSTLPKSGSGWMSRMLRELLVTCGIRYTDDRALDTMQSATFFWNHYKCEALTPYFPSCRVVFLHRDPRDQLVSWMKYYKYFPGNNNHYLKNFLKQFSDEQALTLFMTGFDKVLDPRPVWSVQESVHFVREWMREAEQNDLVIPTTYEDLNLYPEKTLHTVMQAFSLPISRDQVRHVVDKYSFHKRTGRTNGIEENNSPLRKGIVGDWRNHFTAEHKKIFKQLAGQYLIEQQFESDLDW